MIRNIQVEKKFPNSNVWLLFDYCFLTFDCVQMYLLRRINHVSHLIILYSPLLTLSTLLSVLTTLNSWWKYLQIYFWFIKGFLLFSQTPYFRDLVFQLIILDCVHLFIFPFEPLKTGFYALFIILFLSTLCLSLTYNYSQCLQIFYTKFSSFSFFLIGHF